MIEVVWVILQQKDRFLLVQRSLTDHAGGTWCFPGGKIDPEDTNAITAAYRELTEEAGLKGNRFRQLFRIHLNQYRIQIFLCDKWSGELKPSCEDIIGVGWFTYTEMYALDRSLSPFVSDSLSHLSYLMQHYNDHPNEWKQQWMDYDENG